MENGYLYVCKIILILTNTWDRNRCLPCNLFKMISTKQNLNNWPQRSVVRKCGNPEWMEEFLLACFLSRCRPCFCLFQRASETQRNHYWEVSCTEAGTNQQWRRENRQGGRRAWGQTDPRTAKERGQTHSHVELHHCTQRDHSKPFYPNEIKLHTSDFICLSTAFQTKIEFIWRSSNNI